MDFELRKTPTSRGESAGASEGERAMYRLSSQPIVQQSESGVTSDGTELPRTYGTQTLCLMPRDPRTLFAYWDIDWEIAFRDAQPGDRKVHLRVLDAEGGEQTTLEVEPMAGSCYVAVQTADAAYSGEIGYFDAGQTWNCIAASELIAVPNENISEAAESDFATVPFHLSFQRMIDMLRSARQENESLTAQLADLRERVALGDDSAPLTAEERELATEVAQADASAPTSSENANAPVAWTRQRLERILGFGATSPTGGFGGSSRSS